MSVYRLEDCIAAYMESVTPVCIEGLAETGPAAPEMIAACELVVGGAAPKVCIDACTKALADYLFSLMGCENDLPPNPAGIPSG